jgi:glycosyltransferase involved in cell wall biosynthesis
MLKVSVIIPTFNRAQFLRLAIESVLSQTFQDFDIVVVDDESKDDTQEVVRSFGDDRIKYIRHDAARGGSAARNTGITNSDSKYIAFLDDDDEWLPEKLEMQVDLLEKSRSKVGAVYTGHLVVDNNSGKILREWTPKRRGNIYNDMFSRNWISTASSLLLRRDCFNKAGLFDENLPSFQDYDLWIRISKDFDFEYIDKPLVKYRIHGNKIWTNLEALNKGMELMLKKYGDSPEFKKNYSNYYLSLGVNYCYKGNAKKGREAFLKAIKLYPFEIRYYFNLLLSIFGATTFTKLKGYKERLAL